MHSDRLIWVEMYPGTWEGGLRAPDPSGPRSVYRIEWWFNKAVGSSTCFWIAIHLHLSFQHMWKENNKSTAIFSIFSRVGVFINRGVDLANNTLVNSCLRKFRSAGGLYLHRQIPCWNKVMNHQTVSYSITLNMLRSGSLRPRMIKYRMAASHIYYQMTLILELKRVPLLFRSMWWEKWPAWLRRNWVFPVRSSISRLSCPGILTPFVR